MGGGKSPEVLIHKRDKLCVTEWHNAWNWVLIERENEQKIKGVEVNAQSHANAKRLKKPKQMQMLKD